MKRRLFYAFVVFVCLFAFQADASEKVRVGVMKFQSSAADVETVKASTIGDIFTQMLALDESISVMGYDQLATIATEHKIAISGYVPKDTIIEVGKLADCRYIITGTVTEFKMKASISGVWMVATEKQEASAAADLRVIDVQTGETVLATSESGRAAQSGSFVSVYGVGSGSYELNGMEAGAISELTSKLSLQARETISGNTAKVTSVAAKQVTIDLGTMGGARKDALYKIYTGKRDRNQNLAVVKVTDAKSDYSTAVLAEKNSGNLSLVRKGDKIYPTNADELKKLMKGKSFVKSRPAEKLDLDSKPDDILSPSTTTPAATLPTTSDSEVATTSGTAGEFENESTDPAKVIPTYGLPSGEANVRRIAHTNAAKLGDKSKKAYDKYVELAESVDVDYLAAYRAGVIAKNLGKKADAKKWLDKALEINPNYEPAKQAKENLNAPSAKSSKRKK